MNNIPLITGSVHKPVIDAKGIPLLASFLQDPNENLRLHSAALLRHLLSDGICSLGVFVLMVMMV